MEVMVEFFMFCRHDGHDDDAECSNEPDSYADPANVQSRRA